MEALTTLKATSARLPCQDESIASETPNEAGRNAYDFSNEAHILPSHDRMTKPITGNMHLLEDRILLGSAWSIVCATSRFSECFHRLWFERGVSSLQYQVGDVGWPSDFEPIVRGSLD